MKTSFLRWAIERGEFDDRFSMLYGNKTFMRQKSRIIYLRLIDFRLNTGMERLTMTFIFFLFPDAVKYAEITPIITVDW